MIFLNWKKAFDSVRRDAIPLALRSWGISDSMVRVVQKMLTNRFRVIGRDTPSSSEYTQDEGLRTGDPLATVFFIAALGWIFAGLDKMEKASIPSTLSDLDKVRLIITEIIYADDTTMWSTSELLLQKRFSALEELAATAGLEMNKKKTHKYNALVQIKATEGTSRGGGANRKVESFNLHYLDGTSMVEEKEADLLGSRISRTLLPLQEVKRRCQLGKERVRELCDLWRGTGLSKRREIELFEIYVGTKVLYSLETLNLSARDLHFLDVQQMYMIKTITKSEPTLKFSQKSSDSLPPENFYVRNLE